VVAPVELAELGGPRFSCVDALIEALNAGAPAPERVALLVADRPGLASDDPSAAIWSVFAELRRLLDDDRLGSAELAVVARRISTDDDGAADLVHAGLPGLLRSVRAEARDRRVRLVDVDEWSSCARALALVSDEPELAWRGDGAIVPRLARLGPDTPTTPWSIDPEGTVLITGGTG